MIPKTAKPVKKYSLLGRVYMHFATIYVQLEVKKNWPEKVISRNFPFLKTSQS